MNEAIFRTRLSMLRKERRLTQGQMAEMLGVSRPSYTCYELGNSLPTVLTLCKLADFFEVSLEYLLGRTNDPTITAAEPEILKQELYMIDHFRKLSPEKRKKLCEMIDLLID